MQATVQYLNTIVPQMAGNQEYYHQFRFVDSGALMYVNQTANGVFMLTDRDFNVIPDQISLINKLMEAKRLAIH